MSSSVATWETTQKRITYFSFTLAGTMCIFPDAFMLLRSFSFSLSEPLRRKQTRPN